MNHSRAYNGAMSKAPRKSRHSPRLNRYQIVALEFAKLLADREPMTTVEISRAMGQGFEWKRLQPSGVARVLEKAGDFAGIISLPDGRWTNASKLNHS